MKGPIGKNARVILLAALLFLLIAVLYFQRAPHEEPVPAKSEAGRQRGRPARSVETEPDDANSRYAFKVYPGSVRIERDLRAVSLSGTSPTALDGMDREQLAAFRLEKVEKYRQLGFFHPGYSPFTPPHFRIYGPITPGADWLYSVPYYLANPYLLIVLVAANHVTPIDIYLTDVSILYLEGTLSETISGASARSWFEYVYSSHVDYPGWIRLVMVNAWDAGFRYIHLDPSLSSNIKPSERPDSVTRSWHSQHSFFHVGRYKKNNLSPEDRRGWVELLERDRPTRLHVKLWRTKPVDVSDRADLIFIYNIDPQDS